MKKVLIANRGEIALRIIRTCKDMGIETVAIYSPIDRYAPHVSAADTAFELRSNELSESYLDIDQILLIAKNASVDAIHPGYGFLSENAAFAAACHKDHITFIGPSPYAIEIMGSKSESKQLLERADVPLVPGYNGADQNRDILREKASEVGYPLLIKASAGGGGKGMRIVESESDFDSALLAAKREALSAFGDDHVILERYLKNTKHIEVQVFRDTHSNSVYLFERDCSMQRRHQKIIEEAPSTRVDDHLRKKMGEAAVATANAIDYLGAGTVEFLLTEDNQFFFMEMNTRLQVEHPVTEMIINEDLVQWQIEVARGNPLPKKQEELKIDGHAIEVRIYSESPNQSFLPSSGHIDLALWPSEARVDSGIEQGDYVSQLYDPMIAKLIVRGENRSDAIQKLVQALAHTHILGIDTNVALLRQIVLDSDFIADNIDTTWLDRNVQRVLDLPPIVDEQIIANHFYQFSLQHFTDKNGVFNQSKHSGRGALRTPIINVNGQSVPVGSLVSTNTEAFVVQKLLDQQVIFGENFEAFVSFDKPNYQKENVENSAVTPPMSGRIIDILVCDGANIEASTPLFIIEAMKMEYTVLAEKAGVVTLSEITVNQLVNDTTVIMEIN